MPVYHITYMPKLKEICLYFDGGCNFSCHGCISENHPHDCHLDEMPKRIKNKTLLKKEVMSYIKPLCVKRAIFLGSEPTVDPDFLPLARTLKIQSSTYNILITNGYNYVEDKVIDEICLSIKAMSKKIFKNFTGNNNPKRVLENFKRYAGNHQVKLRTESIFIPAFIDNSEIEKIASFIAEVNDAIPYRIDGYIPNSAYLSWKDRFRRPTEDEMKQARIVAERYLKNVSILHYGIKLKYKVKRIY